MEDTTIIFLIATLIVVIPTIRLILCYKNYKNSNYCKATSNSFLSVFWNSGRYGEYSLYRHLQPFELSNCKFLFNLYVPRENGKTSEIDLIMFHPKGLFVIESKNYSGWIFGNESNRQWTQTLPIGYGESHEERFYNPIMQNSTHIRAIRKYIDSSIPVYSVIAFSDKCTLKDITVRSNAIVTYYSDLQQAIQSRLLETNNNISPELISQAYNKLSQFSNADDYIKYQHINSIR